MSWLDTWGPALLASLAGVGAAAAFTWLFNVRADQERKQGTRALVSQELMHNDAALRTLIGGLSRILEQTSGYARALRTMPRTPHWQRSRWDLPDVGIAFSREELTRYSEWYFGLDGVTFLYEQLMGEVLEMARPEPPGFTTFPSGYLYEGGVKEQLAAIIGYGQQLLENRPQVPDDRINRDPGIKRYVQELQARDASTSTESDEQSDLDLGGFESDPGDAYQPALGRTARARAWRADGGG